jgi:hypothetical protein
MLRMSAHGAISVIGPRVLNPYLVAAVITMDHRRLTLERITPVMLTHMFVRAASLTTGAHFNGLVTFKSLGKSLKAGHALMGRGRIAERRHPAIFTYAKRIGCRREAIVPLPIVDDWQMRDAKTF